MMRGKADWAKGIIGLSVVLTMGGCFLVNGVSSQPVPLPDSHQPEGTASKPETGFQDIKAPTSVKQGETVRVQLPSLSATGQTFTAKLAERKVRFFPQKDGTQQALVPVSVFQKPGKYPLTIENNGHGVVKTLEVSVLDGRYRTQNITVSKGTAGLQPLPGEMETIQALKDAATDTRYWEEPFITPTPDCQNSPFGVKRYHNGKATGDYHKGVDLRSPNGRPIKATNAGKVKIATMYRLHGGTVGVDHGHGVSSIYIHMSRLNVKPGEVVKKGDVLGQVGSTGFASGPHLHWGLYMGGLPVNPNQWVHNVPGCG